MEFLSASSQGGLMSSLAEVEDGEPRQGFGSCQCDWEQGHWKSHRQEEGSTVVTQLTAALIASPDFLFHICTHVYDHRSSLPIVGQLAEAEPPFVCAQKQRVRS